MGWLGSQMVVRKRCRLCSRLAEQAEWGMERVLRMKSRSKIKFQSTSVRRKSLMRSAAKRSSKSSA